MKTEVTKTGQHKRGLSIQVEGDIVKAKFDEVYNRLNKEAKVPGFRAGNVPRDILEKHYSAVARQEVLKELLPEAYHNALNETKLEPVSQPEISQVNLDNVSLSFKADLEVKPQVDLQEYKRLKIEYKPVEVREEDITKALDKLKETYKQMPDVKCARSLCYPDMKALREVLERQIYLEKTRMQQVNLEDNIIGQLLKQVNFQVPPSLINQQLDSLLRQAEVDLAMRGVSKEDIQKQQPELKKRLEPQAQSQVRVFLVLEEVAKRENIVRDDKMAQRVLELLLREADWQGVP